MEIKLSIFYNFGSTNTMKIYIYYHLFHLNDCSTIWLILLFNSSATDLPFS